MSEAALRAVLQEFCRELKTPSIFATPSSRCSHFGIARSLPPISSLDSGDFSGHGRGAGEVSRAWGEVAAGVRVIVSRARFGGPGLREPCTTDPVSRRVRGASDSGMDPGKSRNMPLQELLASRRPSPRHFSPVSGYPSFVQAPSLLDPLRRESVGSRRLCLEADVGDVPGRVPVSRCDRESRIPGVIPDYPGLSRIKTFDRPHLRAPAWSGLFISSYLLVSQFPAHRARLGAFSLSQGRLNAGASPRSHHRAQVSAALSRTLPAAQES